MDEAIQDIVYLGNRLKGIVALVPLLEKFGTIENAIKERQQYLDSKTQEREALIFEMESDKEDHLQKVEEATTAISEAETYAASLVSDAKDKVKKVLETAQSKVDEMVSKANFEVGQITIQIQDATDKLNDVTQQTNEIEAKKQVLLSSIADLRSKF